ncbi:hypothetical protein HYFRA_00005380 [Hymenoscyphus fraxineus]|uniref:Uncharacterized protein n=1 Tax=Hymenoscyphus fraxineus TaxID=746836 RepID=A0A9N9LDR8_9HELO|nr:hypothetical protein HYFRA_00005380 [Hymenoscyphus fraxineus]
MTDAAGKDEYALWRMMTTGLLVLFLQKGAIDRFGLGVGLSVNILSPIQGLCCFLWSRSGPRRGTLGGAEFNRFNDGEGGGNTWSSVPHGSSSASRCWKVQARVKAFLLRLPLPLPVLPSKPLRPRAPGGSCPFPFALCPFKPCWWIMHRRFEGKKKDGYASSGYLTWTVFTTGQDALSRTMQSRYSVQPRPRRRPWDGLRVMVRVTWK